MRSARSGGIASGYRRRVDVRERNRRYQMVGLAYLTAAIGALGLSPSRRLGLWLPLHLAVEGAVATSISGAMQMFARALTATPQPRLSTVRVQLVAVAGGAAAIAIGLPIHARWLVALGGVVWVAGIGILGWIVWRAWSRSLHRRHPVPMAAYAIAICCALLGGLLGALLGRGGLDGGTYVAARRAHLTLNVLGFASLTIVGTMVTLLPTVLRVRMVRWRAGVVVGLLGASVLTEAVGWTLASRWIVRAGGALGAAGAVAFLTFVVLIARSRRRWAVPAAALHLLCGVAWFVGGSLWFALQVWRGPVAVDLARSPFLVVFVWGWLVQVLLGAWAYLLPMARAGGPGDHRRGLQFFELGGRTQVAALNAGLVLLVGTAAGWFPARIGTLGWTLAVLATSVALAKTWSFPALASRVGAGPRATSVWGG